MFGSHSTIRIFEESFIQLVESITIDNVERSTKQKGFC
jgi:hypothetical protein